jgi:uncharacterized membrane protein SirB2
MLRSLHVMLAYATVIGFVVRAVWSLTDNEMLKARWVKIVPHAIDTLLLVLGVAMALSMSQSPVSGWLGAKLIGLLAYIGFGVLTLRAASRSLKIAGLCGALASVGYIFSVAFTRSVWPF